MATIDIGIPENDRVEIAEGLKTFWLIPIRFTCKLTTFTGTSPARSFVNYTLCSKSTTPKWP